MGKAVLISIQPYWVFLIIAEKMGWIIGKKKTVEVRKNYPKDENWDKVAKIYCSKDKKSFAKIPKEYQPFMIQFLGKVIGEFVCDKIFTLRYCCGSYRCEGLTRNENDRIASASQLSLYDMRNYLSCNGGYAWHISDLVIYDEPKDLIEFYIWKKCNSCRDTGYESTACMYDEDCKVPSVITRPPQSWCYVEELSL